MSGRRPRPNDRHVRRELVDEQTLTIPVRIADDDLRRTGVACAGDRRERFTSHELSCARVLEARRGELIRRDDAGDSLHVDRDVDLERPLSTEGNVASRLQNERETRDDRRMQ